MNLRPDIFRKRNAILIFGAILLLGSYAVHQVGAQSGGIVGYSKIGCGTPVVGGCHGSQSGNTVISVFTDSTKIYPGKTYVFHLTVANPTEMAAGCDISADNGGKVAVNGYNSGLWEPYGYNELTHNGPRSFGRATGGTGDSAVWSFKYTAPTKTGTAHIFIASNAVDLNGTNDAGDHWNVLVDTLNIVASGVEPTANAPASLDIFPNPSTIGRYTLSTEGMSGAGDVTVSNAWGAIVSHTQIALGLQAPLDLSALPNGTYFLSLRTKDGRQMMRRVVVAR